MTSMTPHEDDVLARVLRGQVDGMSEAPLSVDDITDRAGRIRRHRRLAAAVGVAAAVAAVAVPSALVASSGLQRSQEPPIATRSPSDLPSVTTTSPSPSPTGSAPGNATITPFDLRGAPTGGAPAVAWVDGTTLHRPDGSTVDLPERPQALVRAGDRYLVLGGYDQQPPATVYVVAGDGTVTDTGDRAFGLSGASSGLTGAYATRDGEIKTYWSDGEVSLGTPVSGGRVTVTGVVGNGSCDENAGGCLVFFESGGRVRLVDSHGIVDQPAAGAVRAGGAVATASGWLLSTMTSASDTGSCWQVTDAAGQEQWSSCRLAPLAFAPDAKHALARDSYFDGYGPSDLAVVDASNGSVVVHLGATEQSQVTPFDPVWEDDSHALTVTHLGREWAVVRVGLDGSVEYAVPPVRGGEFDRPFVVQSS